MLYGLVGGCIAGIGLGLLQNAIAIGPGGPCYAIIAMSSVLLVIIEALLDWEMVSIMEFCGCILGTYGVLIITNHGLVYKYCLCCLK
jgi:uncharacterized membrane protein